MDKALLNRHPNCNALALITVLLLEVLVPSNMSQHLVADMVADVGLTLPYRTEHK